VSLCGLAEWAGSLVLLQRTLMAVCESRLHLKRLSDAMTLRQTKSPSREYCGPTFHSFQWFDEDAPPVSGCMDQIHMIDHNSNVSGKAD
jgi:hypothetical protein